MSATQNNEQARREVLVRASAKINELLEENRRLKSQEPVAVVGMGCRFPGGANSPSDFWDRLVEGVDAVGEIPAERWDVDANYDRDPEAPGKMYTREGAFLEGIDQFDAAFFGITPPEAEAMDPQQRLLLEVAWETIENGGLDFEALRGSNTGIFLGLCNYDYIQAHVHSGDATKITPYSGSGVMFSTAAGRLSYHFDFRGPCVTTDTACSSSLVALHLAIKSLQNGECDLALSGGVNLLISLESYIALCKVNALSPDGRCRPFDDGARGYGRGEGCGMIALKRLSDAQRDGDLIHAVLRGSAVNHDGRSNGLTAPNGPAQQEVITRALDAAGVSPESMHYIEAHGTGTSLGDPIEVQALDKVFGEDCPRSRKLLVGSVKSNIGHTEAAAGIAGVIKAILSVQHGKIPATLHLRSLNSHVPWDRISVEVVDSLTEWPATNSPRVAGVSSFGLSGTNAHIVIGQAPETTGKDTIEATPESLPPVCLLPLSAKSGPALKELAARYHELLANDPEISLADLCFTASSRAHHRHRLAAVAESTAELGAILSHAANNGAPMSLFHSEAGKSRGEKGPVFLFTGQGAHYAGMGRDLMDAHPVFRDAMRHCDDFLRPILDRSILDVLNGPEDEARRALSQTAFAQPALFSLQTSLVKLWRSCGVAPAAVAGHSIGELAAAWTAGAFSLESGLRLAAERGRLMQAVPGGGTMAAVRASKDRVAALLTPHGDRLCVAAINAPEWTTVSGEAEALAEFLEGLDEENLEFRRLDVSHAFHSPRMAPMIEPFEAVLADVHCSAIRVPFFSTLTGGHLEADTLSNPGYWTRQILQPVRFRDTVHSLRDAGYDTFLEIGPGATLTNFGRQCLPNTDCVWLAPLHHRTGEWRQTASCLAQLYTQGANLSWKEIFAPHPCRRIHLPTYPFQRKRYWLELPTEHDNAFRRSEPDNLNTPAAKLSSTRIMTQQSDNQNEGISSMNGGRQRSEKITEDLLSIASELLQIPLEELDPGTPLLEMGADSIVLARVLAAIEQKFGVKVVLRQLFEEFNSLSALAAFLASKGAAFPNDNNDESPACQAPIETPLPPPTEAELSVAPAVSALEPPETGEGLQAIFRMQLEAMERIIGEQLKALGGRTPRTDSPRASQSGQETVPLPGDESGRSDAKAERSGAQFSDGYLIGSTKTASLPPSGAQPMESETLDENGNARPGADGSGDNEAPAGLTIAQSEALARSVSNGYLIGSTRTASLPPSNVANVKPKDFDSRQKTHLEQLTRDYNARTGSSKKLAEKYRQVLADNRATAGFRIDTKEMHYPIFCKKADGAHFWDEDGNRFIDISMGFGVSLFGHNPAFVNRAIDEQLDRGLYLGPHASQAGEIAELIAEFTGLDRVAFFSTGTEAVMTALRAARVATGRSKTVVFKGSYHGHFDGTLADSFGLQQATVPGAPGVQASSVADVLPLNYDDPESLEIIRRHGDEVATILVEPVQSRRPELRPVKFLKQLRALADELGAVLIFDEMITGFRCHPGGVQGMFGIQADMVTYGKVIGGGLPIGMIAGKAKFMDCFDGGDWCFGDDSYPAKETTFYAGTYNKHPLSLAAALAVLKHLKEEGPALQESLNRRTAQLVSTLSAFFSEHEVPIKVTQFSSLFRFSFTGNLDAFFFHLLHRGIYVWEGRACFLSTAHTEDDVNAVIQAVKESVRALQEGGFLPGTKPINLTPSSAEPVPGQSHDGAPQPRTNESGNNGSRKAVSEKNRDRAGPAATALPQAPGQRIPPPIAEAVQDEPSTATSSETVLGLFEAQAAKTPDAPAVEFGSGKLSYGELDRRAEELAVLLRSRGVRRDVLVGIFLTAGPDYVVSLLAVQKAGGLFMPVDPETPLHRMEGNFKKATPALLITNGDLGEKLKAKLGAFRIPSPVETILIYGASESKLETAGGDAIPESPVSGASDPSRDGLTPDQAAYVIFTSGSTGEPKLILCNHQGFHHFIQWQVTRFDFDDQVRASNLALPTFDVSLREIFSPLASGGTVCIPDPETRMNPGRLLPWLGEQNIGLIHMVPSVLRLLIDELEAQEPGERSPLKPRHLFLAGEALFGRDVLRWREMMGTGCQLVNLYGPSETTLAKLFHPVPDDFDQSNEMVPIGKPIAGVEVLILKNGNEVSEYEIGEIHIGTPYPLEGYYGDRELTDGCFITNPLGEPGQIIYKTGDLGRRQKDGTVEFIGRLDRQVKLRGIRVELAEIDRAVLATGLVKQALAMIHKRSGGDDQLTCYYTADTAVDSGHFREALGDYLTAATIPDFFVYLESFPLNINGKIDRRALPKPENLVYDRISYEPPANETEERLQTIWRELLGIERVGVNSPFLDLGGTSLMALRIISRLKRDFGADISIRSFFEQSTIRQLAEHLGTSTATPSADLIALPPQEHYPVSHAQRRLWILDRLGMNSQAYSLPAAFLLEGEFNCEAFEKALQYIVARHESLRTTFLEVDGEPRQKIHPPEFRLDIVDLSGETDPEACGRKRAREEASTPFDLVEGPLFRASLLKLGTERHLFIANVHHIVFDGWSTGILIRELFAAYSSCANGEEPAMEPLEIHYKDFAAWQNAAMEEEGARKDGSYWQEQFSGPLTQTSLPADSQRPSTRTFDSGRFRFRLNSDLDEALRQAATTLGGSRFMILAALVKTLLHRYTGSEEIVVGTPVWSREHADLEHQVGFYVNTLALRDEVIHDERFCDLFERVKATATGAFDHRSYPFDKLVDELSIERDPSRHPLFDVMIILDDFDPGKLELEGVEVTELEDIFPASSKFDLSIAFREKGEGLEVTLEYNSDLFHPDRMERFAEHFRTLAESIVEDPEQPLHRIPLLPPSELLRLSEFGSGGTVPFPAEKTIHGLFEKIVSSVPHDLALIHEETELTYDELNERANLLAHHLTRNVEPSNVVAVLLERSELNVVAFLGILKAGAVYLPVDPEYPDERIALMLEDSRCHLVLTEEKFLEHPAIREKTVIDIRRVRDSGSAAGIPGLPANSSDLAYVIYTSGSTGKPKGVMLEHSGAINLSLAHTENFGITSDDRILQFAPTSFDASVWEMLMALMRGACLVIAGRERVSDPKRFSDYLRSRKVTVATLPPSYIAQIPQEDLAVLRMLVTAGEAARVEDVRQLSRHTRVINAYGPTETTVCASFHEVCPEGRYENGIPIGRPLVNFETLVLDADDSLSPIGVPGEICVAGAGLARGYLYRRSATAAQFVPHPFRENERIYRTGDYGMWSADGELQFLGRNDFQIKLRGHRIELGEIEHALLQEPDVDSAAVVAHGRESGHTELVGYVSGNTDTASLPGRLALKIPKYMIPGTWLMLDQLPLLPNGKVDYASLPKPDPSDYVGQEGYLAPRNPVETRLAELFQTVLRRERVGVHDNFFSIGGDSILAIQLVSQLHRDGFNASTADLFKSPTIAELSTAIEEKEESPTAAAAAAGNTTLTPIQQWFFEEHRTTRNHFNQAVLLRARERVDEAALRVALHALEEHHDSLRLRFEAGDAERGARFDTGAGSSYTFRESELSGSGEEEVRAAADDLQESLDIANGPIMGMNLFRLPEGDHILIAVHHLVIDAVSWKFILEDLCDGYLQSTRNLEIKLPRKSDSFQTWSEALKLSAGKEMIQREASFWTDCDSVPPARVPLESSEAANCYGEVVTLRATLSEERTRALVEDAHRAYGTNARDLLLCALARTLAPFHRETQGRILLEGHGREAVAGDVNVSRTIGWFTSLYPVVIDFEKQQDIGGGIKAVKEQLRRIPNNGIGYGILKYLSEATGFESAGKPEIGLNYLGISESGATDLPFSLELEAPGRTTAEGLERYLALEFESVVHNGRLELALAYNRNLHTSEAAESLLSGFRDALLEILDHCTRKVEPELTASDVSRVPIGQDEFEQLFADE